MIGSSTKSGEDFLPKPRGRVRWVVLGLLCLLAMINNIDRLALSVAAPAMQDDLGITATDIGLLGSAFSLFYALGQLPSGWLIDRFGPRLLLGVSVIVWSAATAAMGVFGKLGLLVVARGWLGLAEAPSLPATNKIVTQWFPKKEQGIANAGWDSAMKAGPAFLTFLLVWIVSAFGWRWLFLLAGIAGVLFAIVFLLGYRAPEQHRSLTDEERAYIRQDGDHDGTGRATKVPWAALFRRRSMWGMMGGYFCNMFVYQIFLTFIPLFVIDAFGVEFESLGLVASIPWIGAIIGDLVSGVVSGRLSDRPGWTTMRAKKTVIIAALVLQAVVLTLIPFNGLFGDGAGLPIAVTLMAFALGFNGAVVAHAWSLPAEVTTRSTVASVASLQNFGGFLGATVSPLLAGVIVDATGSFDVVFLVSAAVAVCSAVCYHLFVNRPVIATSSLPVAAHQD